MTRGSVQTSETTVGAVYEAALAPALWPEVIDRIRCQTDGALAAMFYRDDVLDGQTFSLLGTSGYPAASLAAYACHFSARDIRSPTIARLSPHEVYLDDRQLAFADVSRSAIYNDLFRPIDGGRAMGANLFSEAGRFCVLSVHRSVRGGEFRRDEVEGFARLVPHVVRALQVYRQIARSNRIAHGLASALDHMGMAVLLVDGQGVIVRMNGAAEAMLGSPGCPLRVDRLRLTGARPQVAADLRSDIAQAVAIGCGRNGPPPPVRRVQTLAEEADSFGVMVAPLRDGSAGGGTDEPLALVFVSDPSSVGPYDAEALMRQFGLSRGEASVVAGLAAGDAVDTIAARRGVGRNTVRVQLRSIFLKMEVRSQGGLIALACRSLAALRRPGPP